MSRSGGGEESGIYLESSEFMLLFLLIFLAHREPDVGIDDMGTLSGGGGIRGEGDVRRGEFFKEICRRLAGSGGGDCELEAEMLGGPHPGNGHVRKPSNSNLPISNTMNDTGTGTDASGSRYARQARYQPGSTGTGVGGVGGMVSQGMEYGVSGTGNRGNGGPVGNAYGALPVQKYGANTYSGVSSTVSSTGVVGGGYGPTKASATTTTSRFGKLAQFGMGNNTTTNDTSGSSGSNAAAPQGYGRHKY